MYGTWTGHQATAIVNPDRIDRVPCAPKSQILTAGHCRFAVAKRRTYPRSEVRSAQVVGVSLGGFDPSQ